MLARPRGDMTDSLMGAEAAAGASAALPGDRRLRPGGLWLWLPCFAVVVGLHAGALALLRPGQEPAFGAPSDAIAIELAPDLSLPASRPDEVAGPEVTDSVAPTAAMGADSPDPPAPDAPPPTRTEETAAAPAATAPPSPVPSDAVLPPPAEPRSATVEPEARRVDAPMEADRASETRDTAASRASEGSAGLLGGGRRPSAAAQASWRGEIGQHLVRFRRYPAEARADREQGTARVLVTIDGEGHVLGRDLLQSSGHSRLDREALEMMIRSDPFPKPPPGLPAPVSLNVPVKFAIR